MRIQENQFRTGDGYSILVGSPVMLLVSAGKLRTTLRCTLVGETVDVVRIRIASSWEVDIPKIMVLSIEALPYGDKPFFS